MKEYICDIVFLATLEDGFFPMFLVEDFIFYVKNDTTFYKGFKHLRFYTHNYKSELQIFNKKRKTIASLNRSGTHFVKNNRAWVEDEFTSFSGKVYTNKIMRMMRKNTDTSFSVYAQINKLKGKYKYYTPEAFDKVFFPYDGLSVSLNIGSDNEVEDKDVRDAKTIGMGHAKITRRYRKTTKIKSAYRNP